MFLADFSRFNDPNTVAEFKRRYEKYLNNHLNDLSNRGMIRINSSPGYIIKEPNTNIKNEVDNLRGLIKNQGSNYANRRNLRDALGGTTYTDPLTLRRSKQSRINTLMEKRRKRLGNTVMTGGLDPSTYKTGSGENFNIAQKAKESAENQAKRLKDFEEKIKLDNEEFIRKVRENAANNVGKSKPVNDKAYENMVSNLKDINKKMSDKMFKRKWYNTKAANIGKAVVGGALGAYALKKAHDYQKKNQRKSITLGV